MDPSGVFAGYGEGIFHYGAEAALVDVAHGEGADACAFYGATFEPINVPNADKGYVLRIHFGGEAQQVYQRGGTYSHTAGQGHAVDVTAGAGLRSVHVGMGVDPEQADFLIRLAMEVRDTCHGSHGYGVIAPQHQRELSFG